MQYYLKERIGDPYLFTGRKKELDVLLNWVEWIKKMGSKSLAFMARRKMGKTAILERIYNIVFEENGPIVPFYYEIQEGKRWSVTFFQEFFLTFVYQYLAFKTRKMEYMDAISYGDFEMAKEAAKEEGLDFLIQIINSVALVAKDGNGERMWDIVRKVPKTVAQMQNEFILQIIDEFQFLNSEFYWDKEMTRKAFDISSGYLSTAESKVAPLLISGSWVGMLMYMIMKLPGRFSVEILENMPEDEAIEMIFKYAKYFNVPIAEECAYLLYTVAEGSPFYISSIIRSRSQGKDLTTVEGLMKILEFETLDKRGDIKGTWMEYVDAAFSKVNERNAKNIVLYLCKNREREVTRKEIMDDLKLDMTDVELEKKLKALIKADIIQQGRSNFYYRGVEDNIFDKVFRGVYQDDIDALDPDEIKNEYKALFVNMKAKYHKLLGTYNYQKGYFAEYIIINQLKYMVDKDKDVFKKITNNLPEDFEFAKYNRVWCYKTSPEYDKLIDIDIFAMANNESDYCLICEIKNRETSKFSHEEAEHFVKKANQLRGIEKVKKFVLFVFSRTGFTTKAEDYCRTNNIAFSENEKWLDKEFGKN